MGISVGIYRIIVVLSSFLVILPAHSECEISQAMLPLQEAVQSFQDSIPQDDADLGKLSDDVTESTSKLRSLLPPPPKVVPQSFCTSLAKLGNLLTDAVTSSPYKVAVIGLVVDDLHLKVAFLSKNLALTDPRYVVAVTVSTKRKGTNVSGYVVSANPLLYEGSAEPLFSFAKLSSPTTMNLPPGKYVIAATQDGSIGCRRQLDVGTGGEKDLAVDCPLQ